MKKEKESIKYKDIFIEKELDKAIEESSSFENFWNSNKSILIEYAEKATGEQIDSLEPLLTIDYVRDLAQEYWYDYIKHSK